MGTCGTAVEKKSNCQPSDSPVFSYTGVSSGPVPQLAGVHCVNVPSRSVPACLGAGTSNSPSVGIHKELR